MPVISAIAAMARNRVIGIDNQLPWHLPADLKHFRSLTMGHHVIMGRKNYESIGKPLPGRTNIVVTRDKHYQAPGCVVCHSPEQALIEAKEDNEVFIIGGATLYQQLLPETGTLYLTHIDLEVEGDTFFPEINWREWLQVTYQAHEADGANPYPYIFATYRRKTIIKTR